MVVVPLPKQPSESPAAPAFGQPERLNWTGYLAGGALVAGGLLLISGRRKAGVLAASAGTALALLDQQETLNSWWKAVPGYIDEFQKALGQVQDAVSGVAAKREAVRRILVR